MFSYCFVKNNLLLYNHGILYYYYIHNIFNINITKNWPKIEGGKALLIVQTTIPFSSILALLIIKTAVRIFIRTA